MDPVRAARLLWEYLRAEYPAVPSDAIFAFGGRDLTVPGHVARLYADGYAPLVLVTGATGPYTDTMYATSEAETYAKQLRQLGLPEQAIVLEPLARNTGENVAFGMQALVDRGYAADRLLLVGIPFLMRRASATFAAQFPSVVTVPSPPPGTYEEYAQKSPYDLASRLVAEVERLFQYASFGFCAPVSVPKEVIEAVSAISGAMPSPGKEA